MEIFRIIGVAFVTAVAAIVLKCSKPELSFAVTVTGVVIILIFVADMLQNTVNIISSIAGDRKRTHQDPFEDRGDRVSHRIQRRAFKRLRKQCGRG